MIAPARLLAALLLCTAMPAGISISAAPAAKPVPTLPEDRPGSFAILLGVENVRDALKLSALQRALLDSIRDEYRYSARKIVKNAGTTTASRTASLDKLKDLTAYYNDRAIKVLSKEQRNRFNEIEHQILGGYMLLSPKVQQALQLTEKQKAQLASIYKKHQDYVQKVNRWYEDGEVGSWNRLLYLQEDRTSRSESMMKVLTPAQQKAFKAMEGAPFRI